MPVFNAFGQQVLWTLGDALATRHLHFGFGSVEIRPSYFAQAADAIRSGKISIAQHADKFALYDQDANQIVVPNVLDKALSRRALIIHEGVHLINDLFGHSISAISDEAAAYIAQAIYILDNDNSKQAAMKELDPESYVVSAAKLAQKVIDTGYYVQIDQTFPDEYFALWKYIASKPGATSNRYDYSDLRKKLSHYDGVPGVKAPKKDPFEW